MRWVLAALLALAAVPTPAREWGSDTVRGDGKVTEQKRDVPSFDSLRVETSADVEVKVGPPASVTVKIDGNLQELLTTKVEKGVLVIDATKRMRMERSASVSVTVPQLRRVELSASGDVVVDGGTGPVALAIGGSGDLSWRGEASRLEASVEGSGTLRLEGRADRLEASVEGSGDIDARKLQAVNADARVEGSGDIDLNLAGGTLDAEVDGSGDIRWRGEAKTERIAVHGSGEISRRR
jgi:Putative auto-transporter adhesin, head GIN domain